MHVQDTTLVVKRFDPGEPEWDSMVVQSCITLCDVTMPTLSECFGNPLAWLFLTCGLLASGFVAKIFAAPDDASVATFILVVRIAHFPLSASVALPSFVC